MRSGVFLAHCMQSRELDNWIIFLKDIEVSNYSGIIRYLTRTNKLRN